VEHVEEFDCFGSRCAVRVAGDAAAAALARRRLLACHARFTRFDSRSELSHLNADPRVEVPVSAAMAHFAQAALDAAALTGGLVDPTLLDEVERAGYTGAPGSQLPLAEALAMAPPRRRAWPHPEARWRRVEVDERAIRRPPGVALDSGGLKGFFADLAGRPLAEHASFAIECGGDVLVGGAAGLRRAVRVDSPFGGEPLHELELRRGGVATSGIGKRSWLGPDGAPAHHVLDPATGHPCFSGLVQATAIAPTALHAEALAKAALLSGPGRDAERWLRFGGVLVYEDASHRVVKPAPTAVLDASYGLLTAAGQPA
jgi:thiamine biosynthesis lipoprotein